MYRPKPKKCIHPQATAGVCVCTYGPLNHNRTMAESDSRPSELVRRQSIVLALRAGMGRAEIIRKLKLPKTTVYRVAKAFSQAENSEEGSYTGARKTQVRERPKRSPKLVEAIRERISTDHHISQRRLATEFRVSRDTVQNVIHKDLKCKAYRPKVRQMLSEANRKARVERCGRLLQSLKTDTARRKIQQTKPSMYCQLCRKCVRGPENEVPGECSCSWGGFKPRTCYASLFLR